MVPTYILQKLCIKIIAKYDDEQCCEEFQTLLDTNIFKFTLTVVFDLGLLLFILVCHSRLLGLLWVLRVLINSGAKP